MHVTCVRTNKISQICKQILFARDIFFFFFYKRALGAPNQEEPDGGFEEKQYYMNKIIKES